MTVMPRMTVNDFSPRPASEWRRLARMAVSAQRRTVGYPGASLLTGLKVRSLRRLVAARRIPHIRYSDRVVRFDAAELEQWVAEKTVKVAA